MSKLSVFIIAWFVFVLAILTPWACKRDKRKADERDSLIATTYFRAGVATAVMVKARGLDTNVVTYDDFLAVCLKAWVENNTNDATVLKIK